MVMNLYNYIQTKKNVFLFIILMCGITSCKKQIEYTTFGTFAETFPANASEANAAVSYCYTGMVQKTEWNLDWITLRAQDINSTDEIDCNWQYQRLRSLNFDPDFNIVTSGYTFFVSFISQITLFIDKIEKLNMPDAALKARYIGELKGLRGYYTSFLYSHYGPVPIRVKPEEVNNPDAPVLARPSDEDMIKQIVGDLTDAIAVLPAKFTGSDYGRFSKAAALTCRMKLYMQLKRWRDAISDGEMIKTLGFSLIPNYNDNFGPQAKGGNAEIIFPIVCTPTAYPNANMWFAYVLSGDYMEPNGVPIAAWNGWRMPWKTYNKFDLTNDQRTLRLLRYYPSNARGNNTWVWRDALTGDTATSLAGGTVTPVGTLYGNATMVNRKAFAAPTSTRGAIPMKFTIDDSKVNSQNMNMDFIIYRYADVLLLLAEAYNNTEQTGKAIPLINEVRNRAGLSNTTAVGKTDVQAALEDERLFELYAEGNRREDLIRWGKYAQRAVDDGSSALNPNWNAGGIGPKRYDLYPIPRSVISQSNGIIKQNPGY